MSADYFAYHRYQPPPPLQQPLPPPQRRTVRIASPSPSPIEQNSSINQTITGADPTGAAQRSSAASGYSREPSDPLGETRKPYTADTPPPRAEGPRQHQPTTATAYRHDAAPFPFQSSVPPPPSQRLFSMLVNTPPTNHDDGFRDDYGTQPQPQQGEQRRSDLTRHHSPLFDDERLMMHTSAYHPTAVPHRRSADPTTAPIVLERASEPLLLDSHLTAYEALVGTLTKQVLLQQQQLVELRDALLEDRCEEDQGRAAFDLKVQQQQQKTTQQQRLLLTSRGNDRRHDARDEGEGGAEATTNTVLNDHLKREVAGHAVKLLETHMVEMEQRMAASLAARLRSVTREHVLRSVDHEVRRAMRDRVVAEENASAAMERRQQQQPPRRAVGLSSSSFPSHDDGSDGGGGGLMSGTTVLSSIAPSLNASREQPPRGGGAAAVAAEPLEGVVVRDRTQPRTRSAQEEVHQHHRHDANNKPILSPSKQRRSSTRRPSSSPRQRSERRSRNKEEEVKKNESKSESNFSAFDAKVVAEELLRRAALLERTAPEYRRPVESAVPSSSMAGTDFRYEDISALTTTTANNKNNNNNENYAKQQRQQQPAEQSAKSSKQQMEDSIRNDVEENKERDLFSDDWAATRDRIAQLRSEISRLESKMDVPTATTTTTSTTAATKKETSHTLSAVQQQQQQQDRDIEEEDPTTEEVDEENDRVSIATSVTQRIEKQMPFRSSLHQDPLREEEGSPAANGFYSHSAMAQHDRINYTGPTVVEPQASSRSPEAGVVRQQRDGSRHHHTSAVVDDGTTPATGGGGRRRDSVSSMSRPRSSVDQEEDGRSVSATSSSSSSLEGQESLRKLREQRNRLYQATTTTTSRPTTNNSLLLQRNEEIIDRHRRNVYGEDKTAHRSRHRPNSSQQHQYYHHHTTAGVASPSSSTSASRGPRNGGAVVVEHVDRDIDQLLYKIRSLGY